MIPSTTEAGPRAGDVAASFLPLQAPSNGRRRLLAGVGVLAAAGLGGCAVAIEERHFLPVEPGPTPPPPPTRSSAVREAVALRAADGHTLHGLRLRLPQPRGTVLYFPGNAERLDDGVAMRLWALERLGLDGWAFDRRGFGATGGQADAARLGSDALTLFDQVRAATAGRLMLHGFSLGSVVAAHVVRHRPVTALVSEGSISTVAAAAQAALPWWAGLLRPQPVPALQALAPLEALRGFDGPLLLAVGERDTQTPPVLSRQLAEALKRPGVELAVVPGAGHQALITPAGHRVLAAFCDSVFGA